MPLTRQPQCAARVAARWAQLGLVSATSFNRRERDAFGNLALTRVGTGHTQVVKPGGMGISTAGGSNFWTSVGSGTMVGTGAAFAVLFTFAMNSTGQTNKYLLTERVAGEAGGSAQSAVLFGFVANTLELFAIGYSGADPRTGSQIVVDDTLMHTAGYNYDGATLRGYLDGRKVIEVAKVFSLGAGGVGRLFSGSGAGANIPDATIVQHATFSRAVPDAVFASLTGNPWQLFQSPPPARKAFQVSAAAGFKSRWFYDMAGACNV